MNQHLIDSLNKAELEIIHYRTTQRGARFLLKALQQLMEQLETAYSAQLSRQ